LTTRKLIAALNAKTVDRAAFRQVSEKTAFPAKIPAIARLGGLRVKTQSA
jgi:hypothetical protein